MAAPLVVIILAAGEGTRMNSKLPKVLHEVAGWPMIDYVLANARAVSPVTIYAVVGAHSEQVVKHLGKEVVPVLQKERLGTGHAVMGVAPKLKKFTGDVLVLSGDNCMVRSQTLLALRQFHRLRGGAATLLTARVEDPYGYGRIVRGAEGQVERIVEEKDASESQRRINEINAGVYMFKAPDLLKVLKELKPNNAKGEYYLTDTIQGILRTGGKVEALMVPDRSEVLGINDRAQLSQAHRTLNLRRVEDHQREGVTFLGPQAVEIGPEVVIGKDTVIETGVTLSGKAVIGEDCRIERGSVVHSSTLGKGVVVKSSRIMESKMGDGCDAGPFAHVRGGSVLAKGVHVGTNTELKGAKIGDGSKVGHFSYVGDATLGKNVNVGAGCVFANYDGKNKHPCKVGDGAFLGSNSTLVAPITIGTGAVVGAGAVVTKNVPNRAVVAGVPAKPLGTKMKKG
jgi:bifunctional UDP-N-acetylglucosamine pyrophosphorylase/glucosamine-1-phosphate N-acetyltransferase